MSGCVVVALFGSAVELLLLVSVMGALWVSIDNNKTDVPQSRDKLRYLFMVRNIIVEKEIWNNRKKFQVRIQAIVSESD